VPYYHVLAQADPITRKDILVLKDASLEQLLSAFVVPYLTGEDFECGSHTVKHSMGVNIFRSERLHEAEVRDYFIEQSRQEEEFMRESGMALPPLFRTDSDIRARAKDVTAEFIRR
jgi:hypothetical protein